jgi:hypothetical protein
MVLEIPKGAEVHEMTNSTIWFDDEGILYSVPRGEQVEFTNEQIDEEMKKFRAIIGDKKVCLIAETHPTNSKQPSKEQREIFAKEIASVTKAIAIITTSSLSKMLTNLFFAFKPPSYPAKMFKTEAEAKDWIRQYL